MMMEEYLGNMDMDPTNQAEQIEDNIGDEEEITQKDAWAVIGAYFENAGLVRQQLDSFHEFIQNTMREIHDEFIQNTMQEIGDEFIQNTMQEIVDEFIRNTMQETVNESVDIEIHPESQHNPSCQSEFSEVEIKPLLSA